MIFRFSTFTCGPCLFRCDLIARAWDFPTFSVPLAERSGARLCFLDGPQHSLVYSTYRRTRVFDPIPRSVRSELGKYLFMQSPPFRDVGKVHRSPCNDHYESLNFMDSEKGWSFIHGSCEYKKVVSQVQDSLRQYTHVVFIQIIIRKPSQNDIVQVSLVLFKY